MTDTEKMAELLQKVQTGNAPLTYSGRLTPWTARDIADHLIANGVTFAKDTDVSSKWIGVEDDKPDEFVSVLGHIADAGELPAVRECYRVGNAFYFPTLWDKYPVDKWMPLPEPPKED